MKEIARRETLQAVAGLLSAAVVGTVAGRRTSAPPAALDAVPATADAVVDANVDALRRDDGMRTLTTAALQQRAQYQSGEAADGPRTADALLADVETEFDADPAKVHRAVAFGDVGSAGDELFDGYAGVVLGAELSAEAVKSGIENIDDVAFDELHESGTVVYEPDTADGPWVGALGSNRVVVGTEAAVYDVVDVTNGETAAVGGPVGDAYADTRDGRLRFAGRLPDPSDDGAVPRSVGDAGQSIDLSPLGSVTTLAGAVYRDGDVRGLSATLSAADAAAARDVARVVRKLRERAEAELRDDAVADLVGGVAVERDGATVSTSVERTVGELQSLVDGGRASY
ncbi:hypothetical protein [Haloarcula onubensis]|uniref:Uncharacterized protein n=1 Tax=Haloarcula onubensis TaxID=2950539 RepID=A0ABU2FMZ1_9EURY|nr:hypothetical protein [Halomicroarcula sp. S3CR25-11]MDS0282121.1 hypothetical protein [Halomicroarcula sp. S3CR25-11]